MTNIAPKNQVNSDQLTSGNLSLISAFAKKAAECQSDIDFLNSEITRCEEVISAAGSQHVHIDALKNKRSIEAANAFIDRRQPDISSIDLEISKAEKASAKAREDGRDASVALPIIRDRIALAVAQIKTTNEQLEAAVVTEIMARHDSAQEQYFSAIESMRTAVETMVASEKTWRHVLQPSHNEKFPGRGIAVLSDIRSTGLRVRWQHSLLKEEEISSQYLPGFESSYFLPWWADERNVTFSQAEMVKNIEGLRAAGCPCASYEVPKLMAAGKKDVIEVIHGMISIPTFKINAATGLMELVDDNWVARGETVALPASEAANLVIRGMAKYVDGRSKEDAYRFLHPTDPLPANIQDYRANPRPLREGPQPKVSYEGHADGERPASAGQWTPGLVGINSW
ncbi:hypothetical protein [Collimonas silvisoli]|uniref:hypothetical protein n=1 Tax=Collimonas silvisoli TaxID=2825884 RepID=UPI001B8BE713|nr:hypothetical protein [Collimonas silvisoli]